MDRAISRRWIGVLGSLLVASGLPAEEWSVVGARQMGMGGAGVATTRGALGSYWNPAALAPPRGNSGIFGDWDISVPLSASVGAVGGVLGDVNDVVDLLDDIGDFNDLDTILDDPAQQLSPAQIQSVLKLVTGELDDLDDAGSGLVVNANVGLAGRIGYFGLSVMGFAHGGGITRVDFNGLALGDEGLTGAIGGGADRSGSLTPAGQAFADSLAGQGLATQNQAEELVFQAEQSGVDITDAGVQASLTDILQQTLDNIGGGTGDFLSNNSSGVNLRGILLQEYAVAFAYPFFDIFSVGVNAKVMHGRTYFKAFTLRTLDDAEDLVRDLYDDKTDTVDTVNVGIDIGVLVQPFEYLSIGLVGRNLNRPQFDFEGRGQYTIAPQYRAGVALQIPGTGVLLAVDADIFQNPSEALTNYDSQVIGGGVEWSIFETVLLRGGVSKNVAVEDEGFVIHAGLAFNVMGASVEVAGSMSPEFTKIGDDNVPERASAGVFVGINVPLD